MSTNKHKKKKVFVSYKSDDDRSREILEQLVIFFERWGLDCQPVDRKESTDVPQESVNKELGESHYLIQLINQQKEPSQWMKIEWDVAKTLIKTHHMVMRIAFYTAETPINTTEFKEYAKAHKDGTEWIINVDMDKSAAGKRIEAILKDAEALKEKHGEIVLPAFCYHPRDTSEISLKSFQDFIDNFRHAHSKGLSSVYPDKYKPTAWLLNRLKKLKNGEKVRMLGFTLNRYVYPKNKKGIGEFFRRAVINNNCKAELLIFDRECKASHDRMKIESPADYERNYKKATLYKDNEDVEKYYTSKQWKGRVFIRKYRTPYMGMLIFDDMILVEIYHLGHDGKEFNEKTICGRVPVLFIRAGTPFYKLFKSHFERVWEIAKK